MNNTAAQDIPNWPLHGLGLGYVQPLVPLACFFFPLGDGERGCRLMVQWVCIFPIFCNEGRGSRPLDRKMLAGPPTGLRFGLTVPGADQAQAWAGNWGPVTEGQTDGAPPCRVPPGVLSGAAAQPRAHSLRCPVRDSTRGTRGRARGEDSGKACMDRPDGFSGISPQILIHKPQAKSRKETMSLEEFLRHRKASGTELSRIGRKPQTTGSLLK